MGYGLPKSVEIDGQEFAVRYDFRVILDIFEAINDPELSDEDRALAVLHMFYVDFEALTDYDVALKECFKFINGGQEQEWQKKQPQLVAWEQDFQYIVAPVNRVLGYETRALEYDQEGNTGGVHWWTFLSAYMEIGDCLFAQIVGIRSKKAKGKKLDKTEQEFYRKNKETIEYLVLIKKSGNRRGEVYEDKTDNLFITFVFAGGLRICRRITEQRSGFKGTLYRGAGFPVCGF